MIFYTNPSSNYAMVHNTLAQDSALSFNARGLALYLLSLPKNWKIRLENVAQNGGICVNSVKKYLKELKEAGYLEVVQIKDSKGKFEKDCIYSFCANLEILKDEKENTTKDKTHNCDKKCKGEKLLKSEVDLFSLNESKEANNNDPIREPKKPLTDNLTPIKKKENLQKEKKFILRGFEKTLILNLPDLIAKDRKAIKEKIQELSGLNEAELKAYHAFLQFRREKTKLTKSTLRAIEAKIKRLKDEGHNVVEIINTSIENGWSGLFPPRASKSYTPKPKKVVQVFDYEKFEVVG